MGRARDGHFLFASCVAISYHEAQTPKAKKSSSADSIEMVEDGSAANNTLRARGEMGALARSCNSTSFLKLSYHNSNLAHTGMLRVWPLDGGLRPIQTFFMLH